MTGGWSFLWHRARRVGKTTAMAEACKKIGGVLVTTSRVLARELEQEHGIKTAVIGEPERMRGRTEPVLFEPEAVAALSEEYERKLSELDASRERLAERLLETERTLDAIRLALRENDLGSGE